MGKVISIVGQKGGGSKSTKARTLAVGFSEAGWKTHLADIDTKQQTSLKWTERREKSGEFQARLIVLFTAGLKRLSG